MGTKVTISPLGSPLGSSFTPELNNDLDQLADEFDNVIYRDGSVSMTGNLNFNSKRLYNLPLPVGVTEAVRLGDVMDLVDELTNGLGTGARTFTTRADMSAALALPGTVVHLTEAGREGIFVLSVANNLANVTADPGQGIYVPVEADSTGASGAWIRQVSLFSNVKWFGVVGNGVADDTTAIARALSFSRVVYFPSGTYVVSQINMLAGRQIVTEGLDTIFQQKAGTAADTPVININVSKVKIGSATIIGNYGGAGDTLGGSGEGMHGILVKATAVTGNLSDITLGDYIGQNIRGDVVTTYSTDNATITRFTHGNTHGINVQRNVVSINTGTGVKGGNVTGTQIGYMHLLVEPDGSCAPVVGCRYNHVKGRFAGAVGVDASRYIEGLEIASLDLDPSYTTTSTPAYAPGATLEHAFQMRNLKNVRIGRFKANGFNGQVIKQVYNPGEIAKQAIHIGSIEWTNNAITEATYLTYVLGSGGVTRLTYDYANVSFTRTGGSIFRDCDGMKGGVIDLALGADTFLLYVTDDAEIGPIFTSTTLTGRLAQSCSRVKLKIGSANVDYIAIDSDDLQIEGGTITAVTPFVGDSDEKLYPVCINTRINGVEYLNGIYSRSYLSRSGAFNAVSIVTSGTITGSNLSGTNTGDQFTNVTAARLLGRTSAGAGAAQEISLGASLIFNGTVVERAALTGDVTSAQNSNATSLANSVVTYAKIQNVAASRLLGNPTGSGAAPTEISLAGGLAFSGTTLTAAGALTPTSVVSTGAVTSSGTGGVGYSAGAGGTVTQITSRTTGVTINKTCGSITLFTTTTTAGLINTFTVTNSTVVATDTINISQKSGLTTGPYIILVTAVAAGSFNVTIYTPNAVASDAPVFNFAVIKAVNA